MKRLFEAAGIDYPQWRALVRAYVWIDYAALFGAYGASEARAAALRLTLAAGLMTLIGFGLAVMVWTAKDPFLAATLLIASTSLWTGLIVIAQPASLVAPEDHEIIGFRPVDSRTIFATRVTAILLPALETIVIMGWLPVVAFLTRGDGSFVMAAAAALAVACASACCALAIVALFGWLITLIPAARLARILAYAGGFGSVALSAMVMVGMNHLVEAEAPGAILQTDMPRDLRTLWFPPAWFASYVAIASGDHRRAAIAAALLSIVALAVVLRAVRGRVSSTYTTRIAEFTNSPTPRAASMPELFRPLRNEARAVALLVVSHLRSDVRFQLSVASSIVMGSLFGFVMGSSWSLPVDPFDGGAEAEQGLGPLFALLFAPSQIYQALAVSASHGASWMFYSTPADRPAIITAGRDTIAGFLIAPLTLLLSVYYVYAFGHVWHALLHAASLGLMAYGCFQLNVLFAPRMPFSVPMPGNHSHGFPIFTSLAVMMIGTPVFILFHHVAYLGTAHTVAAYGSLLLLNFMLIRLTRRRLSRGAANQDYSEM